MNAEASICEMVLDAAARIRAACLRVAVSRKPICSPRSRNKVQVANEPLHLANRAFYVKWRCYCLLPDGQHSGINIPDEIGVQVATEVRHYQKRYPWKTTQQVALASCGEPKTPNSGSPKRSLVEFHLPRLISGRVKVTSSQDDNDAGFQP